MKKKFISFMVSASMFFGILSANAVSISFVDLEQSDKTSDIDEIGQTEETNLYEEVFNSEIIEIQNDEIYIDKNSLEINANSSEATDYGIMTTAVEDGTLEYVKTVSGHSYTAFIRYDGANMYWSKSTGYDTKYEPYINVPENKNASCPHSSYGSRTAEKVPIFENIYLSRGSILYFHLNGSSCSHSGSTATLYLSDAHSSPVSYNSDNQKYDIGTMVVTSGQNASGTDFWYTIHKSGYYTVDAIGKATACSRSYGHGIYMNQTYYIYRYKYSISYNLNNGSLSKTNPTYYYEEDEDIVLNNPTKTGYTFLGWTGSNGSTASTNVVIPGGSMGNRTYTANWKINQYPVTYIDLAPDSEELGRTTRYVNWNSSVRGSDLGSNIAENVYYNGYYYASDTTATVTTEGAIVYRKFEATNIDKEVNLNWNDNNDKDDVRPDKYTLKLKQNGKVIKEVELPSSQTNYTFTNLPKYDSNGNKYEYSFDASASDRYKTRFDDNGNIIEDYQPASFSVIIPKQIVLDGNTGKADYTVSVNGVFYYNDTLTVKPKSSFIMTDRSDISTMKVNVNQIKIGFIKEDDVSNGCIANGSVQTDKANFAGLWNGTFNFDIKFVIKN